MNKGVEKCDMKYMEKNDLSDMQVLLTKSWKENCCFRVLHFSYTDVFPFFERERERNEATAASRNGGSNVFSVVYHDDDVYGVQNGTE